MGLQSGAVYDYVDGALNADTYLSVTAWADQLGLLSGDSTLLKINSLLYENLGIESKLISEAPVSIGFTDSYDFTRFTRKNARDASLPIPLRLEYNSDTGEARLSIRQSGIGQTAVLSNVGLTMNINLVVEKLGLLVDLISDIQANSRTRFNVDTLDIGGSSISLDLSFRMGSNDRTSDLHTTVTINLDQLITPASSASKARQYIQKFVFVSRSVYFSCKSSILS